MTEDHKEIWLECKCSDFSYEGRQWCQDDIFECSDHGPDCAGPVKYVRADLHETLKAENERLREALAYYSVENMMDPDGPWNINSDDFGKRASDALKQK